MPVSKCKIPLGTHGSGGNPGNAIIQLWESDSISCPCGMKGTFIIIIRCDVRRNLGSYRSLLLI